MFSRFLHPRQSTFLICVTLLVIVVGTSFYLMIDVPPSSNFQTRKPVISEAQPEYTQTVSAVHHDALSASKTGRARDLRSPRQLKEVLSGLPLSFEANQGQVDSLVGKTNYFISNDPEKWQTNVRNYAMVKYKDIYP